MDFLKNYKLFIEITRHLTMLGSLIFLFASFAEVLTTTEIVVSLTTGGTSRLEIPMWHVTVSESINVV